MKTIPTYRQAHIDLDALQDNYRWVKSLAPRAKVMAMVKSNAYGHGLVKVAKALPLADAFGVATLSEALTLREVGILQRIVLLPGFFEPSELSLISHHAIEIVVHQYEQLAVLEKIVLPCPLKVWLKMDTGMHRLGFLPEHIPAVYRRLMACRCVAQPITIMSHFADADNITENTTQGQLKQFNQATEGLDVLKSIAHSAGILNHPASHFDWVRPGILLYGVSPIVGEVSPLKVQPVMTLQARLLAINPLKKGECVGYGGTWTCDEDMSIGVVSIGYGDGYPRHAPSGMPILVNGVVCPLIGRVSMDFVTVDLRPCPQAKIGDEVTLWGRGLPIETIAKQASTIPYELTCQITSRVKCVYHGESKTLEQEELFCV